MTGVDPEGGGGGGTVVAHNGARIFGGAERWTVGLLARLQARGHSVHFLCRDEEVALRSRELDVPAEVVRVGGHIALHDAARLAARLRALRPDGLLLSTFKKTWLASMGATLAGVPRVVARIGLSTDLPSRRFVYRIAFSRWIDRVVVNADGLREPVLAGMRGRSPDRVVTLYNGVEPPDPGPPGRLRDELGLSASTPVIGTVARLAEQKRLDRLLRTFAALAGTDSSFVPDARVDTASGWDVHLVVAGDGPERGSLEVLVRELAVSERVHFLGHREDTGVVLSALDVFVATSDREGMSNAMLEALAAGVPVVSTPVSGADEALDPLDDGRRPGLIVPPSPEALAGAVADLLADAELRKRMGAAARERARSRFDWADKVRRWEELLTRDVHAPIGERSDRRAGE